ncbi:hypothetical protein VTK26DRAFT_3450 [Humicola hyalothermophila]
MERGGAGGKGRQAYLVTLDKGLRGPLRARYGFPLPGPRWRTRSRLCARHWRLMMFEAEHSSARLPKTGISAHSLRRTCCRKACLRLYDEAETLGFDGVDEEQAEDDVIIEFRKEKGLLHIASVARESSQMIAICGCGLR